MQTDLEHFLEHLRSERQLSPRTLEAYRHDLTGLRDYLHEQGVNDWAMVDTEYLRRFVARRHEQGLSGRSLQRALSSVRSLYRYLIRERRCRHNPALDLRAPKSPRKLPRALDADLTASCSTRLDCASRNWPGWICMKLTWSAAKSECSARAIKPVSCLSAGTLAKPCSAG